MPPLPMVLVLVLDGPPGFEQAARMADIEGMAAAPTAARARNWRRLSPPLLFQPSRGCAIQCSPFARRSQTGLAAGSGALSTIVRRCYASLRGFRCHQQWIRRARLARIAYEGGPRPGAAC